MAQDFVYIGGRKVEVGDPGDHDFEFIQGESITDTGESNLVFTTGVGWGGAWDSYFYESGPNSKTSHFEINVGTKPLVYIDHDGSITDDGSNAFGIIRRKDALAQQDNFTVTFREVDASTNGADNNRSYGVFNGSEGTRPFDNQNVSSMYFSDQETSSGSGTRELKLATADGSGSQLDSTFISPPSYPADFSIVYDGSSAEFRRNGSTLATLNAPGPSDWYPAASLEDDGTISAGDTLTIDDVDLS